MVLNFQEYGFAVSLDDFGSKHSNLSVLSYIDFQLIKLDRSLIDRIGKESKSTRIVQNLIGSLCSNTLKIPSLAEGVETIEQAKALKHFGCDYVQGHYFSKPVSMADFGEMLNQNKIFEI